MMATSDDGSGTTQTSLFDAVDPATGSYGGNNPEPDQTVEEAVEDESEPEPEPEPETDAAVAEDEPTEDTDGVTPFRTIAGGSPIKCPSCGRYSRKCYRCSYKDCGYDLTNVDPETDPGVASEPEPGRDTPW